MKLISLIISTVLFISSAAYSRTANQVYRMPSSGNLPAWGPVNLGDTTNAITGSITNNNIAANTVTSNEIANNTIGLNQIVIPTIGTSVSLNNFAHSGNTGATVVTGTAQTLIAGPITLVTRGGPITTGLFPNVGSTDSYILLDDTTASNLNGSMTIQIYSDFGTGSQLLLGNIHLTAELSNGTLSTQLQFPPSTVSTMYSGLTAGSHTFSLYTTGGRSTTQTSVHGCDFWAYEVR